MFDRAVMLFLYTETPLHVGSGTSLGIVDLPIQRERVTSYPIIQASGLKGCLRYAATEHARWCQNSRCALYPHNDWSKKIEIVFGPDTQRASDHAGSISVGDARILLLPVRSLLGVFAWVTSWEVLGRFQREAQIAGMSVDWKLSPPDDHIALVAKDSVLVGNDRILLEEFAFTVQRDQSERVQEIAEWLRDNALPVGNEYEYWRDALLKRLVVLSENTFRDFVQFSTEVIARVRIDNTTKTVVRGALWTEEHLPSETLLYATIFAGEPRVEDDELPQDWKRAIHRVEKMMEFVKATVDGKHLQLGGDSTVGRGLVKVRIWDQQESQVQSAPSMSRGGES